MTRSLVLFAGCLTTVRTASPLGGRAWFVAGCCWVVSDNGFVVSVDGFVFFRVTAVGRWVGVCGWVGGLPWSGGFGCWSLMAESLVCGWGDQRGSADSEVFGRSG